MVPPEMLAPQSPLSSPSSPSVSPEPVRIPKKQRIAPSNSGSSDGEEAADKTPQPITASAEPPTPSESQSDFLVAQLLSSN